MLFRFMSLLAGLYGASGVALSAMAAHSGGSNTVTAANFLLFHAPVVLLCGSGLLGPAIARASAGLAAGILLFCGDLLARDFAGTRLFPYAAPAGGIAMIAGWLAIAVLGLLAPASRLKGADRP